MNDVHRIRESIPFIRDISNLAEIADEVEKIKFEAKRFDIVILNSLDDGTKIYQRDRWIGRTKQCRSNAFVTSSMLKAKTLYQSTLLLSHCRYSILPDARTILHHLLCFNRVDGDGRVERWARFVWPSFKWLWVYTHISFT